MPPDDKPVGTFAKTSVYPASRTGFLLPDNTMIYMGTEKKDGRLYVRTLGMGPGGKGYDSSWAWDDTAGNNLTQIKLKP